MQYGFVNTPALFTRGNRSCVGDLIIKSRDGGVFCVSEAVLTMSGCRFRDHAVPSAWQETYAGLPQIRLSEDGETIRTLLQVIHPLPTQPIRSLELGLKCLAAADKYGLHPSLFRIDYTFFTTAAAVNAPFDLCALAWCTGDWAILQHAFRFTHAMSSSDLVFRALRLPKGGEVLAACLATRGYRQRMMLDVVSRLPRTLICATCRSNGHNNATMALVRAIDAFFDAPFPDTSLVFDNPEGMWLPYLPACPTQTCAGAVQALSYTPEEYHGVKHALALVPQTIQPWIIEEKAAHLRLQLATVWYH